MSKPDTPKRGRPPIGEGVPVRVDRDTHVKLLEIARREGLSYAGQPSASKAIAWLAQRDR